MRDKVALLLETLAFHARHDRQGCLDAKVHIGSLIVDLRLRRFGGDIFIFHEILRLESYKLPREIDKVGIKSLIDLGANIGLATLYLASHLPDCKIYCVEPLPENASLLRHNLAGLKERVSIVEAAVSNVSGEVQISLAAEHYNASLKGTGENVITVKSLTMQDLVRDFKIANIDAIKMDIEGAERELLADSPTWLNQVKLMLAELHGPDQELMCSWIRESGLQIHLDGSQLTAVRI